MVYTRLRQANFHEKYRKQNLCLITDLVAATREPVGDKGSAEGGQGGGVTCQLLHIRV